MGEKKRRLRVFKKKVEFDLIIDFVKSYQHSLRALLATIPKDQSDTSRSEIATIGRSDIWPCKDGVVVLIYNSMSNEIEVLVKELLNKSVDEFLSEGKTSAYYDENGNPCKAKALLKVGNASKTIIHLAGNILKTGDKIFKTKYQRAIIIGWDAKLEKPDVLALNDFKSAYTLRNLAGAEITAATSDSDKKQLSRENANKLILEFKELLDKASKEEELQVFIKENPKLLYPDYIKFYPKFKLGEDYVTDYVFLVQSISGPEYVFVEIESPTKAIFTKAGQFTAELTQVKDQILDWERWIEKNHAYVKEKLSGLYKPQFHIVMGRDNLLSAVHREKLRTEYSGTSRRFSTYDDLASRFIRITEQLL